MKRTLALIVLTLLILPGIGCRGGSQEAQQALLTNNVIDWWGVFDSGREYAETIKAYQELHPNTTINYRRLRYEEYEGELLKAFAEGRGPDILTIQNSWIPKYSTLIEPMPPSIKLVFVETRGTLKKEQVPVVKEIPTLTQRQLRDQFVDVVAEDVIRPYQPDPQKPADLRIWGLPSSVDTLALFYNRDLLNRAGISAPATTWREFQEQVKLLTSIGGSGSILQAGAAIGTAKNVERASDILSILMMQNGAPMVVPTTGMTTFASASAGGNNQNPEALEALRFYTDFANPIKEVYTWNDKQSNSLEAFANGTVGYFLGYSYHIPILQTRNPKLNFSIAKLPQISGGHVVNYANYWVHTVAKDTNVQDPAWDFIQFLTSKEQAPSYLSASNKPTALRDLINTQIEDLQLAPFAGQVLTAQSWYKGRDPIAMETIFEDMIDEALLTGEFLNVLRIGQSKVNQTL